MATEALALFGVLHLAIYCLVGVIWLINWAFGKFVEEAELTREFLFFYKQRLLARRNQYPE